MSARILKMCAVMGPEARRYVRLLPPELRALGLRLTKPDASYADYRARRSVR
jgi:hypothetical protein